MCKNCIVGKFMEEHSQFFRGNQIVRGLYIRDGGVELFVLEQKEWKDKRTTFVFQFDCGTFASCKTEINTMEKYLLEIPDADFAEFVNY